MTVSAGNVELIDMNSVVKRNRLRRARLADPVCLTFMAGFGPENSQDHSREHENACKGGETNQEGAAHAYALFSKSRIARKLMDTISMPVMSLPHGVLFFPPIALVKH